MKEIWLVQDLLLLIVKVVIQFPNNFCTTFFPGSLHFLFPPVPPVPPIPPVPPVPPPPRPWEVGKGEGPMSKVDFPNFMLK